MARDNFGISQWNYFKEVSGVFVPMLKNPFSFRTVCVKGVICQHPLHQLVVAILCKWFNPYHSRVELRRKAVVLVQNEDLAAARPCAEILAGYAKNHDDTSGH